MAHGPVQVFHVGITSGASTSSSLDLGGKSFSQWAATYVTMSTGAELSVYGSHDNSTFKPVYERVNTAPVQHQAIVVGTATSGSWAMFRETPPFRYVQFVASAVVSGGVSISVMCSD